LQVQNLSLKSRLTKKNLTVLYERFPLLIAWDFYLEFGMKMEKLAKQLPRMVLIFYQGFILETDQQNFKWGSGQPG